MAAKTQEQKTRAYELLDFLEKNPDSHNQNFWVSPGPDVALSEDWPITAARALNECGTTACAAGWTVLLAGGVMISPTFAKIGDDSGHVLRIAASLLGLDCGGRQMLFYEAEDLAAVRGVIEAIYGPDERPR